MGNYELYHYGILGMKWGVRRFQNKNGTLTAKGKKRYSGIDTSKVSRSNRSKKQKPSTKTSLRNSKFKSLIRMGREFAKQSSSWFMDVSDREFMNTCTQGALWASSLAASGGFDPFMF